MGVIEVLTGFAGISGLWIMFAIMNDINILPFIEDKKGDEKKIDTKQGLLVDFLENFSQRDYGELTDIKNSTIETEGSKFMVYITEWGYLNYYVSISHLEFGRVMNFSYEEQQIKNFNSVREFVDSENVEKVKEYVDVFITKYIESKMEAELLQHAIKQKMEGSVRTNETIKLDTDIMELLNEIDVHMEFIFEHLDQLDVEKQYRYEQVRYTDVRKLIDSYKQLDESLKKKNKANLLDGLIIIQAELEDMVKTIQNRNNHTFERNLEIVKHRN